MRLFVAALVMGALAASVVQAQTPSDPTLAFTISGGLTTGGPLWHIAKQPLIAPGPTWDTVALDRRLRPGITASLGMTYYRSPNVGLNAEVVFFGLGSEQGCVPPAQGYNPDAESFNEQACTRANGAHIASSIIAFLAGMSYRIGPEARVQPYVRANAGIALLGNSFVETSAPVQHSSCSNPNHICEFQLITESHVTSATWVLSLAGGITYWLGPGYRVRMEFRDLVTALPQVTGPAVASSSGNQADTRMLVRNIPVFTMGLDVLLERRHTRRY